MIASIKEQSMKRWPRRIAISLALTALTLGILYECATHVGRGWLFGEEFYEGRPTSWWRHELAQWEIIDATPAMMMFGGNMQPLQRSAVLIYQRDLTWWDRLRQGDWAFWQDRPGRIDFTNNSFSGPAIVSGHAEAEPVLRALLDDPAPRVRRMARLGLKMESLDDGQ
jgi:hypothetical protein